MTAGGICHLRKVHARALCDGSSVCARSLCVEACPQHVIALAEKKVNVHGYRYVEAVVPDACVGCTSCAIVCPDGCITVYRKKED